MKLSLFETTTNLKEDFVDYNMPVLKNNTWWYIFIHNLFCESETKSTKWTSWHVKYKERLCYDDFSSEVIQLWYWCEDSDTCIIKSISCLTMF